MSHEHLPQIDVPLTSLHPIIRALVEAGGGTFRVAPVSGFPHGMPLLVDNSLYPFGLYLTESHEGLAPALKNERGDWMPVLMVSECMARLPMLGNAYYRATRQKAA